MIDVARRPQPDVAAVTAGDVARERQTEAEAVHGVVVVGVGPRAAAVVAAVGSRAVAPSRVALEQPARLGHPLARVHHREVQVGAVVEHLDLDPRRGDATRHRGPDGVVDQVAEHGRDVAGLDHGAGHEGLGAELEQHAALRRLDALRPEERLEIRLGQSIGVRHGVPQGPVVEHVGQVAARLLGPTELEHAREGVQAVGELVALRPEGRRHRTHRVEPAREGLDGGPVADHGDPAEVDAVARDRAHVDQQHVPPDDERRVARFDRPTARTGTGGGGAARALAQQLHERGGEVELVERPADARRPVDPEEARGLVVADRHDPVARDREHPLAHPAEHRLLVLHQRRQLLGLKAEGRAVEPSPDQHGRHDADHQGQHGHADHGQAVAREGVVHPGGRVPDAHLAHDRPRGARLRRRGVDRHLGAGGLAERAALPRHDLLAAERGVRTGAHPLADARRIGVGQAHTAVVRDDDEERPGALLRRDGRELQVARRQRLLVDDGAVDAEGRDLGAHVGVGRDALRHGERGRLGLARQALDGDRGEHGAGQQHDRGDDGELQQQHLGGEAALPEARCRRPPRVAPCTRPSARPTVGRAAAPPW
nr:hypothetical protein GCM10025699_67850 [Microbacterium flavescens]